MAVMELGDPVMIFAGYEKEMGKFLKVNPGLRSRIYRTFTFPDYTLRELGEIFNIKVEEKGFTIGEVDVADHPLIAHFSRTKEANECTPCQNFAAREHRKSQ